MLSSWILDEDCFGKNFQPGRKEIHVLVELPEVAVEPPKKKQRLEGNRIAFAGPLHQDECAVPFDTIDAFRQIKEGLSRKEVIGHPLFLLYGPRQFGKTTISYRIMDWIAKGTFWNRLGRCIDNRNAGCDYDSFKQLVEDCATQDRKQLCLIVDEMDHLFSNKELAIKFLLALRKWKAASYFRGFLGIGSHELVHHHEIFRENDKTSPFNVGNMIKMAPFSVEQMSAFFKLIDPRYSFPQSLQCGIMKYSSGAPGVFGSLIRFTVDKDKWTLEWREWERGSKWVHFPGDLRSLTELEWEALKYILEDNGSLTASTVEGYCGIAVRGDQQRRLVDPLLRMGIMMCRVCVEALPEREIHQAANTDDPVLLLSVALGQVYPKTISNHLVRNRQAPTLTRGIYAEVKTPGSRRRADILIANGVRVAYELKSNQLRESEIEAAAKQADGYRQQFNVDRMVVVNFVPMGHTLDEVYRFTRFLRVQIVHAQFADSCDQFSLQYLGETNEVLKCSVKCLVRNNNS
ncbi:putative P-loop containing nucleoside triphosphate hydrolase [Plasmopara halstedii]